MENMYVKCMSPKKYFKFKMTECLADQCLDKMLYIQPKHQNLRYFSNISVLCKVGKVFFSVPHSLVRG